MNEIAKRLIHDLRFDARTREHFDIDDWCGKGTCKTVGCIAGTAIMLAWPHVDLKTCVGTPKEAGYYWSSAGAYALGISDQAVANQLFEPWGYWIWHLNQFPAFPPHGPHPINRLSHNERPSLDTIEKMKHWAENLPCDAFHPTHCANALENLLVNERRYVDWAEAWEAV